MLSVVSLEPAYDVVFFECAEMVVDCLRGTIRITVGEFLNRKCALISWEDLLEVVELSLLEHHLEPGNTIGI